MSISILLVPVFLLIARTTVFYVPKSGCKFNVEFSEAPINTVTKTTRVTHPDEMLLLKVS